MPGDDMRARRAERARQKRIRNMPKRMAPYIVGGLAVLAVVAAVGWAATHQPPSKTFVHEHAGFAWVVEGQYVSFRDNAYDCQLSQICDVVHMHSQGAEGDRTDVLHVEGFYAGGVPDWGLARIFDQYGMSVAPADVKFDTRDSHNGSEWRNAGNLTWHGLLSKGEGSNHGPYNAIPGDWTQYIPREGDKILLTYGNPDANELAREEQYVGEPISSAKAPGSPG